MHLRTRQEQGRSAGRVEIIQYRQRAERDGLGADPGLVGQVAVPALLVVFRRIGRHDDAVLLHDQRRGAEHRLHHRRQGGDAEDLEEDVVLLQQRAGLAGIAAKAKFHALTRKFLGLLSANRRADALIHVVDCFRKISAEKRGVVSAEIVTALPLSAAQAKGVASALRTALGKDPEISTRVDAAILGGIKVRVGSRLFDASLKSKLDSLKFALKRA